VHILALGAHYDDLELSCGGTLAKFIYNGHVVHAIVATSSDYSSYKGKKLRTKLSSYKEGINGLRALGVPLNNIINLGFPTKDLSSAGSKLVEKINYHIDLFKPDLILTPHINAESHQDHLYLAHSVLSAARYQNNIWMYEPLYPSKLSNIPFRPVIYVDVSDFMDKKIASLKEHKSQWKKYPDWEDVVRSVGRTRGIEIQKKYAEAYEPIKQEFKI